MSSASVSTGKNPRGFPLRLRLLMDGEGWTSRDLSRETNGDVSHATIENWLKDAVQAGVDQVQIVADVFGWTGQELFYGHPGANTMTRVAELESALRAVRRSMGEGLSRTAAALAPKLPVERATVGSVDGVMLEDSADVRPGTRRAVGQQGKRGRGR